MSNLFRNERYRRRLVNPQLHYNFALDRSLVARVGPTLDITRATTGTFFDAQGILRTAASGEARFEFDPVTGTSLGLLVEEERTNLCLQSAAFSTTPWDDVGTPIINTNAVVAPDGTLTADNINDDSGAAFEGVSQLMPISSAIATYTFSVYVKKTTGGTSKTFGINWRTAGGSIPVPNPKVRLNTDTGEIQDANSGINSVEDAGDWWRLITQITTNTANTDLLVQFFAATGANNNFTDAAGTTGIVTVWGAQAELGASASSYIPTTTVTVQRNADVVKTTDVSWVNENGGTFYTKVSVLAIDPSNNNRILCLNDGGTTDVYDLFVVNTTGIPRFLSIHSSDTDASISGTALVAKVASEFALAYADDDFALFQDGTSKGTDTTAAVPLNDAMAEFNVGSRQTSVLQLNGHIAEIRYYNVRQPNDILTQMSKGIF